VLTSNGRRFLLEESDFALSGSEGNGASRAQDLDYAVIEKGWVSKRVFPMLYGSC
jgi:hypothetical protein